MMKKRLISLLLTAVFVLGCAACGSSGGSGGTPTGGQQPTDNPPSVESQQPSTGGGTNLITINTSTVGGNWYPPGTALANTITTHISGCKASAVPSAGTVENVNAILDGTADIAMAMCDVPYEVYHGTSADFDQYTGFRVLCKFSDNIILMVAKKSANINSFQDLVGKKVGMSVAGSNAYNLACAIVAAHGIDVNKDIEIYQGGQTQQVQAMKDGNIDAYIMTHPSGGAGAGLMELDTTEEMMVVPYDVEALKKVSEACPVYEVGTVNAGFISCITEDMPTIHIGCMFFVDESMDEELVYQITKTMFENKQELDSVSPVWMDTNEETAAVSCPFPLHPGAERYYAEVGWDMSVLP